MFVPNHIILSRHGKVTAERQDVTATTSSVSGGVRTCEYAWVGIAREPIIVVVNTIVVIGIAICEAFGSKLHLYLFFSVPCAKSPEPNFIVLTHLAHSEQCTDWSSDSTVKVHKE